MYFPGSALGQAPGPRRGPGPQQGRAGQGKAPAGSRRGLTGAVSPTGRDGPRRADGKGRPPCVSMVTAPRRAPSPAARLITAAAALSGRRLRGRSGCRPRPTCPPPASRGTAPASARLEASPDTAARRGQSEPGFARRFRKIAPQPSGAGELPIPPEETSYSGYGCVPEHLSPPHRRGQGCSPGWLGRGGCQPALADSRQESWAQQLPVLGTHALHRFASSTDPRS